MSSSTGTSNQVQVLFGNTFLPVDGIGGFEVETYLSVGGLTSSMETCPAEESSSDQYVAIFVDQSHTPTTAATVYQGQSARRWIDEANRNAYAKPPGPPPAPPPLVEALRFRRQYSSNEMLRYEQLGITPPVYEIELR